MKNPCQLDTLDKKIAEVLETDAIGNEDADEVEFVPAIVSSIRKEKCIECPVEDLDGYLRGLSCGNHLEVSKETRKVRNGQTDSEGIIKSVPDIATPVKRKAKHLFNPRVSRSLGI
jgi:hypothetical protein